MYQLIVCDLDETLLDSHHKISEENKQAIHMAAKRGIKFVPCTGRGFSCIQQILKELKLEQKEQEYAVSFNGSAITENKHNKLLYFAEIPFTLIKKMFDFGIQKHLCIQIYTAQNLYTWNMNEDERERLTQLEIEWIEKEECSLSFLKGEPVGKMLYETTDIAYLTSLEPEIKDIINDQIAITYSSFRYMELNRSDVSKGSGLMKLAQLLDIPIENTIAIGDNHNDKTMLEVAGLSVAVKNAVPEIKAICDVVTQCDHDHSPIAEVIHTYVL